MPCVAVRLRPQPKAHDRPRTNPPTGEIKGIAVAGLPYIGGQNGQVVPETGFAGRERRRPDQRARGSRCPTSTAATRRSTSAAAPPTARFDIKNVPDGTYQLTLWDDDQDYILWSFNVEVADGDVVDVGNKMLVGWFTHVHGTSSSTPTERQARPRRGGGAAVPADRPRARQLADGPVHEHRRPPTTTGAYDIREAYPLGKWLVLEAFNTRYRTTGITYQADNETSRDDQARRPASTSTSCRSSASAAEIDWGVQPYAASDNGGIAGTVTYDTTRNELDPADAASEDYQPGIPDVKVHLYARVACTADHRRRQGEPVPAGQGDRAAAGAGHRPRTAPAAMVKNPDEPWRDGQGPELSDTYTSEKWAAAARLHRPRLRRRPAHRPAAPCPSSARPPTGSASRRR